MAYKHGQSGSPEYKIWKGIRNRCYNAKTADFKYYGARGIVMDEHFRKDFLAFLKEVGSRPSSEYSIDRIDNNKGYVRGNLKWATRAEQANNSRRCRMITFRGETLPLTAQCRKWSVAIPSLDWWIYKQGRDPIDGLEHYIARNR